ncbi:MAG: hypothetical protein C4321_07305 [Chloroflexota bacterium]
MTSDISIDQLLSGRSLPPELGPRFQEAYYAGVKGTLRSVVVLLTALFLFYALRTCADGLPLSFILKFNGPLIALFGILGALTFTHGLGGSGSRLLSSSAWSRWGWPCSL